MEPQRELRPVLVLGDQRFASALPIGAHMPAHSSSPRRAHEGPPPGQNARQLGGVKMPRPHRERDRMAPVSRATGPRQFLLRPYNRWHILKKFKVLLLAEGLNILNAENPRAGGGGVMRRVLWLGRMKMLCLTPPFRTYIGFVEGRSPCVDSLRPFSPLPR